MALPAETSTPPSRRFNWRWRFSLRALLCLITVLGVWFDWALKSASDQQRAVAAIRAAGGEVQYDFEYLSNPFANAPQPSWLGRIFGVDLFHDVVEAQIGSEVSADELDVYISELHHLPNLRSLSIENWHVTAAVLERLPELKQLESLYVSGKRIDDRVPEALCRFTTLRILSLHRTLITGSGIRPLAAMKQLTYLSLSDADLCDADLEWLLTIPALEEVQLSDNHSITDAGVDILARSDKLRTVWLNRTGVTDERARKLQTQIPGIHLPRAAADPIIGRVGCRKRR